MHQPSLEIHLAAEASRVVACLESARQTELVARIWARDHRLWAAKPEGVTDRLGCLDSWDFTASEREAMDRADRDARAAGLNQALLLGMGGSSLPLPQRASGLFGPNENQSALLGAVLGELALAGRDKLTLWIDDALPVLPTALSILQARC